MSEFLTASITIIGGFVVFVFGQIAVKFFIEPIHLQSKTIGEIADSLIFYANLYSNKPEIPDLRSSERDEAEKILRRQASLLISRTHLIKPYGIFEKLRIVPNRTVVKEASRNLILLSNSIYRNILEPREIIKARKEIEEYLDIKTGGS